MICENGNIIHQPMGISAWAGEMNSMKSSNICPSHGQIGRSHRLSRERRQAAGGQFREV